MAVGLAVGFLTLAGQGALDGGWNRIANSGAVWVTVAFFVGVGLASVGRAALAGLTTLIGAVVGYYLAALVFAGVAVDVVGTGIWVVTALVGGPLFGAAGHEWRHGDETRRVVGAALLAAAYAAEGIFTLLLIPELAVAGWVEIAIGLGLVLVLLRSGRERLRGLLAAVPLALLGLVAYGLIDLGFIFR